MTPLLIQPKKFKKSLLSSLKVSLLSSEAFLFIKFYAHFSALLSTSLNCQLVSPFKLPLPIRKLLRSWSDCLKAFSKLYKVHTRTDRDPALPLLSEP